MAAVRAFVHDGVDQMVVASANGQLSTNGLFMLKQPPLARNNITVNTGSAVNSDSTLSASPSTRLLRLEADQGLTIAYEISGPNRNNGSPVPADSGSMRFAGAIELPFGKGYTVSLLQVASP